MVPNRCRLVLIAPENGDADAVAKALSGGDVASLIIPRHGLGEDQWAAHVRALVDVAQKSDVAALVVNDTQLAGRTGADGVHFEGDLDGLADQIAKAAGRTIVGAGNLRTRDRALVIGELRPDYVMFGKTGGDTHPDAHPKNIELGEWWAAMVEIPCIVLGGSDIASVAEAAATGAEFVALGSAVFASPDPAKAVAQANALLDQSAPVPEIADAG